MSFRYKQNQKAYKAEEIQFPELKIESVTVDKLQTFFDYFDSTISNGLTVEDLKEAESYLVQARQYRLNHKNFNVHLTITADKPTKAAIRIFIGPKYNVHGKEIEFTEHYHEFYELDNFIYNRKC